MQALSYCVFIPSRNIGSQQFRDHNIKNENRRMSEEGNRGRGAMCLTYVSRIYYIPKMGQAYVTASDEI